MFLLFDIGGTKSRFAFTDDLKTFLQEPIVFFTEKDYAKELELIKENVKLPSPIQAVIGGFPGRFSDNVLTFSPNLTSYISKNLTVDLGNIFNTRSVSIHNDAQLAALGEANFGAGREFKNVCFITLSTGIGGAIVRYKKSLHLPFSEPGQMIMDLEHNITFEESFSGGSIKRQFGGKSPDASDREFWSKVENGLAALLVNIDMIDPVDVFVIGGGIVLRGNVRLENVEANFKKYNRINVTPSIIKAELGDYSGLYGAMIKLRENYN